ncbi:RhoGAP-domain-containing protein [Schizophyllum commune Tattone D]|nr:RhoGAP-domain-containing protein [Schizophyllum commune Tattone D]
MSVNNGPGQQLRPTYIYNSRRAAAVAQLDSSSISSTNSTASSLNSSTFSSSSASSISDRSMPASDSPGAASSRPRAHLNVASSAQQQAKRNSFLAASAMGQQLSKSPNHTPQVVPQGSSSSHLASRGIALGNAAAAAGNKVKKAFHSRAKKSADMSALLRFGRDKGKTRELLDSPSSAPSSSQEFTIVHADATCPPPSSAPPTQFHGAGVQRRTSRNGRQFSGLAAQVFGNRSRSNTRTRTPEPDAPPAVPPKPSHQPSPYHSSHHDLPLPPSDPSTPSTSVYEDAQTSLSVASSRHSIDSHQPGTPLSPAMPVSPGIASAVNFMRSQDGLERQPSRESKEERPHERPQPADKVESATKDAWRKSDSTIGHSTIRPGATTASRSSRPVSVADSLHSNHTVVPVNKRRSALLTDADYGMPEEDDSFDKSYEEVKPTPRKQGSAQSSSMRKKKRRSMSLTLDASQWTKHLASDVPVADNGRPVSRSLDGVYPGPLTPTSSQDAPMLSITSADGYISPSNSGSQPTGHNIRGRLAAWTATTYGNVSGKPRPESPASNRLTPRSAASASSTSVNEVRGHGHRHGSITGFGPAAGLAKRAAERIGKAWGGFGSSNQPGYTSSTPPSSYSSDNVLFRTHSGQSSSGSARKRGLQKPSGSWSTGSSGGGSDNDFSSGSSGPSLGRRVRGPLRTRSGHGFVAAGIVFGRDLSTVVRDTAIGAGSFGRDSSEFARHKPSRKGSVKRNDLQALEWRHIPALVARCAQHLLIWGVQEEGLFRVSGRASHIAKLRSEFDTGSDWDMRSCSPGDLDPHAVASIFKAFLRELPEPILTRDLIPYFEAALAQEADASTKEAALFAANKGPSDPRRHPGLRKPPSLSTLAMPKLTGMRPASKPLTNVLRSLIAQLPAENRDVLRTVVDLIKATDKASKDTKMPLSNLLLVFCPSLNMNPPLLKVLCETESIWEPLSPEEGPVLDIKRPSLEQDTSSDNADMSDVDGLSSNEDVSSLGPGRSRNGSLAESASTRNESLSGSERMPPFRGHASSPPFSSSAESLITPSTSSVAPSFDSLPNPHDNVPTKPCTEGAPSLGDEDDVSSCIPIPISPKPRRPANGPVQFPTTSTPPTPLGSKRSVPSLSTQNHSMEQDPPRSGTPASPVSSPRRMKKPSLTLLFKRSASPLVGSRPVISGPYLQSPRASSETSLTSPRAATPPVTQEAPPVLDTELPSSPLRLGMGLDPESPKKSSDIPREQGLRLEEHPPIPATPPPGETPIADKYSSSASSSTHSLSATAQSPPSHLRTKPTLRSQRNPSTSSQNHLGPGLLDDEHEEDWTQSVLLASGWNVQKEDA